MFSSFVAPAFLYFVASRSSLFLPCSAMDSCAPGLSTEIIIGETAGRARKRLRVAQGPQPPARPPPSHVRPDCKSLNTSNGTGDMQEHINHASENLDQNISGDVPENLQKNIIGAWPNLCIVSLPLHDAIGSPGWSGILRTQGPARPHRTSLTSCSSDGAPTSFVHDGTHKVRPEHGADLVKDAPWHR